MIKLLSIHIPKTGGTSFYEVLQQAYGPAVSKSFKRRDYFAAVKMHSNLEASLAKEIRVLHGHFYYDEIRTIHEKYDSKVICWLRDPVERVISNFLFFKAGLQNPSRNVENYQKNKHRVDETLLEYAQKEENRNRMAAFLNGIELEELFFIGFLSSFEEDLNRLGQKLSWPAIKSKRLNSGNTTQRNDFQNNKELYQSLAELNDRDVAIYKRAKKIRG